jgi:hypothetical protein
MQGPPGAERAPHQTTTSESARAWLEVAALAYRIAKLESSRPDASARQSAAPIDRVLRHGLGLLVSAPGSTPGADPKTIVARSVSQNVRILIESGPSGVVAVIVA